MKKVLPIFLIALLVPLHLLNLKEVVSGWNNLPRAEASSYVLPAPVMKLVSLEFDGLASDYIFLRSLVFWGSVLERSRTGDKRVEAWEWRNLYSDLNTATDLDPHFFDPYYFGQAVLTWEAQMYAEANTLLKKGIAHRDWDFNLPFYVGFNYFYFLKDNEKASRYLMKAAQKPGAFPLLTSLATRLAVKGKRTENAIIFLSQLLQGEEDPERRSQYELRLQALQKILSLEKSVGLYVAVKGSRPGSLKDLVDEGFIEKMPEDPYGGIFYINPDGEIKTTSNMHVRK
jgi:tetratricopeptide (TPR) repeat protein